MENLFIRLWNLDFDHPRIKIFDWIFAFASLMYGVWVHSIVLSLIGVIAVAAAWYRPISRYQRWLKSFVKKKHGA